MNLLLRIFIIIILPIGVLTSCIKNPNDKKVTQRAPNVILLIGDGMGVSALSSSFYYGNKKSNFLRFNEIGFIITSSKKHKITDSAAGATAFGCGEKTFNGGIGVAPDSSKIDNLVELLSLEGYNTGVVVTSSVTHATPAGFYSHVVSRQMEYDIAKQLVESDIDFFAGGGIDWFTKRPDSLNLLEELEKNGFVINADKNVAFSPDKKYGYLLAENGMPTMLENRNNFLAEYTSRALNYFSLLDSSFFLMVEASQIDWAGHDNNADYLIAEMLDFDQTVGIAIDYAKKIGNTIVIVLADHETGGFALAPKDGDYAEIEPAFATTGHTASLVPVFAMGDGAKEFKGIYQNTDVFHKIMKLATVGESLD